MSSIIEGYNYDIFISYRQNDNKYDGWVTEFVNNLNKELEANIKDKISVYFDINPQDGLLETDSVDKSLEDKLKCLIFVPIISRTYCDSKSFAWQHEFCAFNKVAKQDKFGMEIKLASGNVSSRILPIKIYDLDPEDKVLLENELGGILRSIEFIYKSAGVNRPLRVNEDHPQDNLNKTYYRDQINKVANAVKEIITALKKQNQHVEEITKQDFKVKSAPQKKLRTKVIVGSVILLALIAMGYFFIPKLFKSSEPLEKTIAVLPFRNLSNDTTQLFFCDGFMEEILNNLQKINSFTVRSRTSSDQYRDTKKSITTIGNELNVNYLVEGSVGREGDNIKIWVQLIDSKADKHIWSNDYTRESKQIFSLQSEIAKEIASELKTILSPEEIKKIEKRPTENLEAYNYYLIGNEYYWRSYENQDYNIAASMYTKAIEADPNFALAYIRLALCHLSIYWFYFDHSMDRILKSKSAIDAATKIDPNLPEIHLALGYYHYWGFLNYSDALKEFKMAETKMQNNSECYYGIASVYRRAGEWSLAKENFLKAFELNPGSSRESYNTAETFYLLGEYIEAEKYITKTILLNPTFISSYGMKSHLYLKWKGNTTQAREAISDAYVFKEALTSPNIFATNVLIDIYDGNYNEALSNLGSNDIDIIENQFSFNLKSLLYAHIYDLMNMPGKAYEKYDSARIILESEILKNPDDPRLFSAIGIAYAGLGQKENAIKAGKKAVEMMPINREAYRGTYRVKDLAKIYVMVGKYNEALEQIKLLLSLPGPLSTKLLLLDTDWKPLWDLPEFKRIINTATPDVKHN